MLSIPGPQPPTEALYIDSVNRSLSLLRQLLANYKNIPTNAPNRDLDTGAPVKPGGYSLTDETYAQLLEALTRTPTRSIPFSLKRDILAYYSNPDAPITTKKNQKKWAAVQAQLKAITTMPTSEDPPPVLEDRENPANHGDPGKLCMESPSARLFAPQRVESKAPPIATGRLLSLRLFSKILTSSCQFC